MAKSGGDSTSTMLCVFIVLLLTFSMGMEGAAAVKLCKQRSQNFSGICTSSSHCDSVCRTKDGAHSGSCHFDWGSACFCLFKCGA